MDVNVQKKIVEAGIYVTVVGVAIIPMLWNVKSKSKKIWKKLTWAGYLLVFLTALTLYFNKALSDINDLENTARANKERAHNDTLLNRQTNHYEHLIDSIHLSSKMQGDSSKKEIIFTLAKGYNIVYDSTKRAIRRVSEEEKARFDKMLKDSLLHLKVLSTVEPVLVPQIVPVKITADSAIIQIKLQGYEATAYNTNISVELGYLNKLPYAIKFFNSRTFNDGEEIKNGLFRTDEVRFSRGGFVDTIMVYFKGTFTGPPSNRQIYSLETLMGYDLKNRKSWRVNKFRYPEVLAHFHDFMQ